MLPNGRAWKIKMRERGLTTEISRFGLFHALAQ